MAACLPLLSACPEGGGIPNTHVRDYHVTFAGAFASSSCPEAMHTQAAAHIEYTQTYRIHYVDGPDEATVDFYWKLRGDADSTFSFFAAGLMTGSLDEGNFDYAGGSYEEERGSDQLTYRIEGSVPVRFGDSLGGDPSNPLGIEEFIIEDSSNTADYPIGCVYSLEFSGDLAGATDQGDES
jgi:hypothetical protein